MQAVFFTEGGKNIGLGHLTRCLALAQAFGEKDITSKFIICADSSIKVMMAEYNPHYINWTRDSSFQRSIPGIMDIAVIDSYSAGINIYGQIQQLTKMGVYLDDYNRLPYPAGIVINGSPNAGNLPYPSSARTTYLLGSEFQPLRKPFWSLKTKRHHPVVKSLFLACGGSDPQQLTPMLIQFLTRHYPEIKIIALVGKSFQNPEKMQHLTGARVHILVDPPVEQLIEAMQGSDVAVTAAGQTINELAAVGLPPIVIGVVENQKNNIDGWLTTNFIEFAGWWNDRHLLPALKQSIDKLIADSALRQKKSRIGQRLIDGQGSRRIIMKVLAYVRNH